MAINSILLRRPSDKNLYLLAGIAFPLLVLIGYFKSYYFVSFFPDARPIANSLVHLHGIVMSAWVLYFTAQIALIRTKNVKLHMTMGFAGIGLAALVVIVGLLTAYDSHVVRHVAPAGISPYSFLAIPLGDMIFFILFFTGAIYYRKRPVEHKNLMLMTAINFLPAAISRIPIVPEQYFLLWSFGVPSLLAIAFLVWHSIKYRKINRVFAAAVIVYVIYHPLRITIAMSDSWINVMKMIFG